MAGLDIAQHRLVVDAEAMFLGEREGNGAQEGVSPEPEVVVRPPRRMQSDFVHGRLSPEGFIELPPVPSGSRLSPDLSDRMEKLVGKSRRRTRATPSSVQALLERCGAVGFTYLIPTEEERPWSPPVGYQCVYEAYFGVDTKLWFPIPRLVTSNISRRQVALSQFVNGSYRIAVALMVLSAEIDISLNGRAFEELTSVKALKGGLFAIRMRPNYNIITDHPNKTQKWKKNYLYIKADEFPFHEPPGDEFPLSWAYHPKTLDYSAGFFDCARAIACLSHSRWPDISEDRVQRALERISREVWDSRVPVIKKDGGKRLALFTSRQQARVNKARRMDSMIDLSYLIDDELDSHQANPMSILDDMDLGGVSGDGLQGDISAEEEKAPIAVTAGAKGRGAKRPSRSGNNTAPSDEPSRKRKERSTGSLDQVGHVDGTDDQVASAFAGLSETRSGPTSVVTEDRPIEGSQLPQSLSPARDAQKLEDAPLTEGPPVDPVEFLHSGNSLLIEDRGRCAELIKGEPFDFPTVADLTFGDLYERAAQDQLTCIGSSNLLIAKYERELKSTLVQLGRAQEWSLELEAARSYNEDPKEKNAEIGREKEALDQEKTTLVLEAAKEATSVRESRRSSVEKERKRVEATMIEKCDHRFANIRDYQVRRQAYEDKCLLYAQAFGTRKYLQKLLSRNEPLTQGTVAFFEGKEQKLKADADAQWVGGIPETDLSMSPLALLPQASRDAERFASSSEGQSVDQAGIDAAGNQERINAVADQDPGVSRAGVEDPSE
ncbi:hypothetical protein N665_0071s0028 [Sinapis alba]|nr:hypothetical protein N665_0071s0028 [Sinapis alba]